MGCNRRSCCLLTTVITGVVLIIVGVVFIYEGKTLIDNEISKQINLNSKATFDNWVKNPTPIYFQVWVWNLTNYEEVKNGGKPDVQEIGPYTYRESRQKVNITFHHNNGTVTYRENKYFTFDREKSHGPETDTFYTVNIPMMLVANIVKRELGILQLLAETLLEYAGDTDLFLKLSIKDIIWGYPDPLLNKTLDILKMFNLNATLDDHFGLFIGTNGTDDGSYNIMTGEGDVSQFGKIKSWNDMKSLPYWTTNQSNMLNGTDGTIFNPFVKKTDVMYVFSSDICRSIYLTYHEMSKQKDIDVYRYIAPPAVFLNHTANPANQGFCTPSDSCLPSGLLDVENCRFGAPVVFSQPHFLNAAQSVINSVDGVHPNQEEHQTVIDIEPNTGAAFFAEKKLQVNIQMEPVKHLTQTEKLRKVILPVVWINESSAITDSLANKFKSQLETPMEAIHIGVWVAIGVGIALVLFAVLFILGSKIMSRSERELEDPTRNLVRAENTENYR